MNKTLNTLIAVSLTMGVFVALPSKVSAQGDTTNVSQKVVPKLELEQADVRDALKILFKDIGVSYTVAPDVQGSITVNLHNVPFETALQSVLKQVDATYRVDGGIFTVIKKEPPPTATNEAPAENPLGQAKKTLRRIKLLHADPEVIMLLLAGKVGVNVYPEMSTLQIGNIGGGQGGQGGGGRGGFGGGGFGGSGGGGLGGGGGGMGGGFGGGGGGLGGGGGGFGGGGGLGGGGGFGGFGGGY